MSSARSLVPPQPSTAARQPVHDAFDGIAPRYDREFTDSLIGRLQREQIWRRLDGLFPAGARILDLGCGTGADAIHLARRGFTVHAVDASPRMIAEAQGKVAAAGLANSVTLEVTTIEELATWDRPSCLSRQTENDPAFESSRAGHKDTQDCASHVFDGAISNFGALNCVEHLRPVAVALGRLIRPGGCLALCFISPFCLWEAASYGVQGQFGKASRRWNNGGRASAGIEGDKRFPVYYRPLHELRKAFEPEFQFVGRCGIAIFVPPTYLDGPARHFPRLTQIASRIDRAVSAWPICRDVADHTLVVFRRGHQA